MPRPILTDTKIKQLKPGVKPYKVSDGSISGLWLTVSVAGSKVFYLAYQWEGKMASSMLNEQGFSALGVTLIPSQNNLPKRTILSLPQLKFTG